MAVVGLVTSPLMGEIADRAAHEMLDEDRVAVVLTDAAGALESQSLRTPGAEGDDLRAALERVRGVFEAYDAEGALPPVETANALRSVIESGSTSPGVEDVRALLGPAENYGGLISFRYVVPLSGFLIVVFGLLYIRQRRAGGYRAERLS
ncbi:MAG: hypothetical protein F4X00_11420 [Gemmatimonadetes bacterium]|nr:hypothetical protein [Gemmatimonadota bacterium]